MEGLKGAASQDRSCVNLDDSWEISYWCSELRCDEQQLRAAVDSVGVIFLSN